MNRRGLGGKCKTALLCLWAGAGLAGAQSVVTPPPEPQFSTTPPGMQQYETNQMQVFTPADTAPALGKLTQPLQWKFITLHPHVYYSFLYGTGLESAPGQQQDSIVQSVSPGMLINLGNYWTLDYTPTLTYYSAPGFRNTLDHAVQLTGGTAYQDWIFGLSQGYTKSDATLLQTAAQTEQETYSTALSAVYQINSQLSLSLGANQSLTYLDNIGVTNTPSSSRTWSTMDWVNYEFWPRLTAGVGAGFGYNNQDVGADSIYEQYEGQVNWRATDKVSFGLNGGLQEDQFLGAGSSGSLVTPIFGGMVQYQPFEQTRVTLSAARTVSSSTYFVDQVTKTTQVSADVNQRLLGKAYLDVGASYATDKYDASVSTAGGTRSDDYYTFNAGLTYPILKRGTFAVFYHYSENSSTQAGFAGPTAPSSAYSFRSNQVGFSISYQY